METMSKNFKRIGTDGLTLEVFNASENSFGVASVIIYGQKEAIIVDCK
jgi:hypothetical protein